MLTDQANEVPTIKPLAPLDPGGESHLDLAGSKSFDLKALERIVRSCEEQPIGWRTRSDLCHAYYDNKQLTEEQIAKCRAEGLEPRSLNLISKVVNVVLGHEAKTRSDPMISADHDEVEDAAEAMQVKLKQAQREAKVDMAISQSFSSEVKCGIGWTEVSRPSDPFEFPYRVRDIHRSKIWWDWRATDFMLRDARWLVRKEWHDLDELMSVMPKKHHDVLKMMANGWEGWVANSLIPDMEAGAVSALEREHDDFRAFNISANEWLDSTRKRVCMYEVWYKVPADALALRTSRTTVTLFDPAKPLHQEAVRRGIGKVEKVRTMQVRVALYAGPYRLSDVGTTKRHFPYVPFFAFRADSDQSPYGLVEGMIAPQDEFNERRLRMQWLLKARQVMVDNDALDHAHNNFEDLADEIGRPDFTLVLNAGRRNSQAVTVGNALSLQKEQYEAMLDAKNMVQDVPGVYPQMWGQGTPGASSGVAIANLVEQGIVTMGELYDNYLASRQMVYEQLLDLIVEDHSEADLRMRVGTGQSRRVVVLNTFDPQSGAPVNHVSDLPLEIGFDEVPSSAAVRQQTMTMIAEVAKSVGDPRAVAVLIPHLLEASPMGRQARQNAAEDFRKVVGLPTGTSQQRKQAEAAGAQAQQQSAQAEMAERAAKAKQAQTAAALNMARVREIDRRIATEPEEPVDEIESALDEAEQA